MVEWLGVGIIAVGVAVFAAIIIWAKVEAQRLGLGVKK